MLNGYKVLTDEQKDFMNTLTEIGEDIRKITNVLANNPEVDKRWLAIGVTDLQKGFMSIKRSIAKPDIF